MIRPAFYGLAVELVIVGLLVGIAGSWSTAATILAAAAIVALLASADLVASHRTKRGAE